MANKIVARELAQIIVDLDYAKLPKTAIGAAKDALLDQIGIMLAGATLPWTKPVYEVVKGLAGKPESTVVGYGTKTCAPDAAFVNATFGHSCELDDSGYMLGPHPGAVTVAPALALSERGHLSGRDLLLGIVAGYEVQSRLGKVVSIPALERGFHHVTVIGPFGSAAACGKLLGLDTATMTNAFGIAGSHSGGTTEYDQSGGSVKRTHAGLAARGGMMAALLAQQGLTGPPTILQGLRGTPRAFAGLENSESILEPLGKDWYAIEGRRPRLTSAAGNSHSSIDAMARLMKDHHLTAGNVQAIDVFVTPRTVLHGGSIYEPADVLGAQFSIPFSLGLRLVKGRNELRDYMDPGMWRDPQILGVAKKVVTKGDDRFVGPNVRGARLVATLTDGRVVETEVPYAKGEKENPITREEMAVKFRSLASMALGSERIDRIASLVDKIEAIEDVSAITHLLVTETQL